MKKLMVEEIVCKAGQSVLALGANQTVTAIHIPREITVTLKYAQNHIISDPITLDTTPEVHGDGMWYHLPAPICASHILLCTGDADMDAAEVEVYAPDEAPFDCYPKCCDYDLSENHMIDEIIVLTEGQGTFDFDVYLSPDGRDFSYLSSQTGKNVGAVCRVKVNGAAREARIVRVYLKYCSVPTGCIVTDVKVKGEKSGTPVKGRPTVNVPDFQHSAYNVALTEDDTYDALYGIIDRRIGPAYRAWFFFKLRQTENGHDFFELFDRDGGIQIVGNSGVSLAVGLNHYLKYFCCVNLSQVGDQINMPASPVCIGGVIHKETKAKVRYAYNYCTLSYSMAFWGEEEWQRELDYLALCGVNLILDTTAQEEVWRRFLSDIGYRHEDIKAFLVGPAYAAWAYMANITGLGGPLHDSWFERRTALARKNHLFMRKMGMYPVLQGFSGMMPLDIKAYDPDIDILEQGLWCASPRPPMLRTTSDCYKTYAARFYACQREVYGEYSPYFATDPFHEGGKVGDMRPREISRIILSEMIRERKDAVWVVQSWQGNPTSEFLCGAAEVNGGKEHLLILDLYAEKAPNYQKGSAGNPEHGYAPEFDGTPWVFCMLNNFGGRLGLYGHIDNLQTEVPRALNTAKHIRGIGITPEASENNPVLYDFFFDLIWHNDASKPLPIPNLDAWLAEYTVRRYGARSENAIHAWSILKDTVYKSFCNMLGQGATESIVNARPAFDIAAASAWGNTVIGYDTALLEKALALLEADHATLSASEGYVYDLTSVRLQVMSNKAAAYPSRLKALFEDRDIAGFKKTAEEFLALAHQMDAVAAENRYYTLDRYLAMAKRLAEGTDDFTGYLYPFNAKAQITTWGGYSASEIGQLHDYSNRIWAGLMKDFYIPRWERWLTARICELEGWPFEEGIDWYEMEWHWVTEIKS